MYVRYQSSSLDSHLIEAANYLSSSCENCEQRKLQKAAQGVAQCEVSATRVVVDYVVERADAAVTKLQISPVIVDGFKNGFHNGFSVFFLVVVEAI